MLRKGIVLCSSARVAAVDASAILNVSNTREKFPHLQLGLMARVAPGMPQQRSLYMDFQATAPMDPRVLDAMLPYMTECYGNPHSRTHMYGWSAEEAVEKARAQVASIINAHPKEIVFTSGATESDNMAIKGVAWFYQQTGKNHIVTCVTEHKGVLESCRSLETQGFEVTYLPVQNDGIIDLNVLEDAIKENTALVSIMAINNEIGVIQPIEEIGAICRKKKVFFHCDAAQAVGKMPIDVNKSNIDLLAISGHKIYGPKGVGALYVRRRPRVRLRPVISGGGQERGFRSGTMPTPLLVGLGEACAVAEREMDRDLKHVIALGSRLWEGLQQRISHIHLNGHPTRRYPGNLNISFDCVEGESLLMGISDIAISSGSACTSASLEPSYVLRALGVAEEQAHTSLRFGLGRFSTEEEVDFAVDLCADNVEKLRALSPLWDMVLDGEDPTKMTVQWTNY